MKRKKRGRERNHEEKAGHARAANTSIPQHLGCGQGARGRKAGCADRGAGEAMSSAGDSHEEPGGSGSARHTDVLRAGVLSLISCPLSFTIRW